MSDVKSFHGREKPQEKAFQTLKDRLSNAPILAFLNFHKSFKLKCDVYNVSIGPMLLQEARPIAFSVPNLIIPHMTNSFTLSSKPYKFESITCYPLNLSTRILERPT
ncbi:hypothetical protein CR513_05738, partial [Mucuna pruriens]